MNYDDIIKNHKRFIIDIYCEIDSNDIGQDLELVRGDFKCPDTGKMFTGTFVIKDICELKEIENGEKF